MTRDPRDFYRTPIPAVLPLLAELAPWGAATDAVIEPGCGDGSGIGMALMQESPWCYADHYGVELDAELADHARASGRYRTVGQRDWLKADTLDDGRRFVFILNPPFSCAQEFVAHTLKVADGAPVAALMRLGMLASQSRKSWWESLPPVRLRVLTKRPSFTSDGKTDATEYAWFLFNGAGDPAPIRWY